MTVESTVKPLALLIPGLDGTGRLFYRQIEALVRRYRVLAWDFGAGADFDLASLVSDLGQATAAEPPGSILVVGESFGGPIAIAYVLRHPERVRRLILVNTFPYYSRQLRLFLGIRLSGLLTLDLARRIKDMIVDRILADEGIPEEDRLRYKEIVATIDLESYRRRLELLRQIDLRPRLPEIKVPAVLLAAGRDKIVPSVTEARYMASQIPNARLVEFPEAGHALLLTPGTSLAAYDDLPLDIISRQGPVSES